MAEKQYPPSYGDVAPSDHAGAPLVANNPPPQGGYPPQGAYPPPQQGMYPPPQQGAYPQAGYAAPPAQPQHVVVAMQPQPTSHNDYLGFSIFNLLCCCLCIGIAAVIKSMDVRSANQRGDPNAKRLSAQALTLNKVALGIGIAFNLIWIGIVIALVVTGALVTRSALSSIDWYSNTTPDYYGK